MRLLKIFKDNKSPITESAGYQTFLIFRRFLDWSSSIDRLKLRANAWIKGPDSELTDAILDLRENWSFALDALEYALTEEVPSSQRPYVALREYMNRKQNSSLLARIRAERTRIPSRKRRKISS